MSEALILESLNPQYDERLFIEFQENTSSQRVVYKKVFKLALSLPEERSF